MVTTLARTTRYTIRIWYATGTADTVGTATFVGLKKAAVTAFSLLPHIAAAAPTQQLLGER
jgi:hypothetical protein